MATAVGPAKPRSGMWQLAHARKLTITQVKAYYGEGLFGEEPVENELPKQAMPLAELEAIANRTSEQEEELRSLKEKLTKLEQQQGSSKNY